MRNLLSLLERFTKALNRDTLTKEIIERVILNQAKINLKNFSYKDGVLTITSSAVYKNEIKFKEEAIKGELKNNNIYIQRILYK